MGKDLLWRLGDQYAGAPLDPVDCDPDPIVEFRKWFQDALVAELPTVNAMTLATVDERGRPSARIVLLKEVDDRGFVFFTNYDSRKGRELAANPVAALVMFWEPMHRQVRDRGHGRADHRRGVRRLLRRRVRAAVSSVRSPRRSRSRSRRARCSRSKVAALAHELGDAAPMRPAYWGGFRVVPEMVELWQGQPSRLHDRVRYRRTADGWVRDRLAP